jgi:hypothetical protein
MKFRMPFLGAAADQPKSVRTQTLEVCLAALVLAAGLAAGIAVIGRGIWLDEFAEIFTSRHGPSFWDFLQNLGEDIHPILHYVLLYTANLLGISDIKGLRLLNLLGVPLVIWSLWWTWKQEKASAAASRSALTASQASAVIALYASSAIFLNYLAEARCYFLLISASIAVTLVWRVLMDREGWENGAAARLWAWGFSLAILVNLHYFATLFGGLLTIALLVRHGALREWRRTLAIASIAALAASPALLMALYQFRVQTQIEYHNVSWITTGSAAALRIYLEVLTGAAGYSIPAVVAALAALVTVLRHKRAVDAETPAGLESRGISGKLSGILAGRDMILFMVTAGFFALIFAVNVWHPVVIDRYLFPACGPVIVLLAITAAGVSAPRWSVFAICIFALIVQVRGILEGEYDRPGWAASASEVASAVKACPETAVYAYPFWDESRFGQSYYAELYGFTFQAAGPGDSIPRQDNCANIVWIEHADELFNASTYGLENEDDREKIRVEDILGRLKLRTEGKAEAKFVESGLLILVH